jgi:hypothetical protein
MAVVELEEEFISLPSMLVSIDRCAIGGARIDGVGVHKVRKGKRYQPQG